mmetsp:Transcript_5698/g.11362  ORF Transcript_5698/g.11362 Transcript_5698/m.11362 type:complete len:216 (-) Transcript_5698:15-662(-)
MQSGATSTSGSSPGSTGSKNACIMLPNSFRVPSPRATGSSGSPTVVRKAPALEARLPPAEQVEKTPAKLLRAANAVSGMARNHCAAAPSEDAAPMGWAAVALATKWRGVGTALRRGPSGSAVVKEPKPVSESTPAPASAPPHQSSPAVEALTATPKVAMLLALPAWSDSGTTLPSPCPLVLSSPAIMRTIAVMVAPQVHTTAPTCVRAQRAASNT